MNNSTIESPHIQTVSIRVTQLKEAKTFYTEVIGLKILAESEDELKLGSGGRVLLQIYTGASSKKLAGKAGLYHFALLVPAREDLGSVLHHLMEVHAPLQGGADHIFSEAIYLNDPDGNGIEIYCDRPKDQWQVQEDGSLPLASDPLDAEELLKIRNQWQGLPDQTVIGHIHLHVANIKEAFHFYHQLLGFQVKIRLGNQALFLAADEYHHHIGLNTWAGEGVPPNPAQAAGMRECVFHVNEEREILQLAKRLKEDGYSYSLTSHDLKVVDPSGNHLRFTLKAQY
ncbi:VOC family protein [Halobacillus andaensis]|uniref:VOC family protein n=1 Tax=Halobacillus andaensis TaxID=1176239 RepID=UPI003D75BD73